MESIEQNGTSARKQAVSYEAVTRLTNASFGKKVENLQQAVNFTSWTITRRESAQAKMHARNDRWGHRRALVY